MFNNCKLLKEITIPSGVTTINNAVFANCTSLEKVILPTSLTTLGANVFDYCHNLKTINLSTTGLTSIGNYTFRQCYNLLNINFPSTLTTIATGVFSNCQNLQKITGLTNINNVGGNTVANGGQFQYCYSVKELNLSSITIVTNNMFDGCRRLKSLTIPNGVTVIGASAFANGLSLTAIHFLSTSVPTLNNTNAFTNTNNCTIYVPYSSDHSVLNAYKTADKWSTYASRIEEEPQS